MVPHLGIWAQPLYLTVILTIPILIALDPTLDQVHGAWCCTLACDAIAYLAQAHNPRTLLHGQGSLFSVLDAFITPRARAKVLPVRQVGVEPTTFDL